MKFKLIIICLIIFPFIFNSCGFLYYEGPPYTKLSINLVNNTGNPACKTDSLPVIFKVSNLNDLSQKEVRAVINPKSIAYISLTIKKGEYLNVKVLNAKDSTISIIEGKYQTGKGPNMYNDPPPRIITFCDTKKLKFENF